MSKRHSLSGPRIAGTHTSLVSLAYDVASYLLQKDETVKVSPGIITTRVSNLSGHRRIRIKQEKGGLLLRVRDNGALQEVRVFGDTALVRLYVQAFCEVNSIELYD